jgi:peroxiredoxin
MTPLVLFSALWAGADAAPPARFGLAVGQELRYAVRTGIWFDGPDGKPNIPREKDGSPKYDRHDLTLFVTARNADGGFRVVLKTRSAAGQPLLTFADLSSDGRIVWTPSGMPALEHDTPRMVFPLLPTDERQRREGWRETEERTGIDVRYELKDGEVVARFEGPLDKVSGGGFTVRYRLRPGDGLPDRVKTDGYWPGYKETHDRTAALTEVVRHDAAWAERFDADARRYFEAEAKYRAVLGRNQVPLAVAAREGRAEKVLDEARAVLAAARDAVAAGVFRDGLDERLKNADAYRPNRLESARKNAKIAGLPSPAWKAADLDGKEHDVAAYRGKVVVLDFWFRQCSFCIRAMPQVEQVFEHFRAAGAPVVVFGASIDKDVADARHVAREMKLPYPVLQAKDVAEKYGVVSCPTWIVLDADGKVRGILSGHSLTLREELTECVRAALPKQR